MAGEGQKAGITRRQASLWPSIAALAVTAAVSIAAELSWSFPWYVSSVTGFIAGTFFLLGVLRIRSSARASKDAGQGDLLLLREEMETSRMRAVACLASQIAHDVRNPVAAISGSAQLLSRLTEKALHGDPQCIKLLADEQSALCRAIIEESSRLDAVISRFQSFAELSDTNLRAVLSVSEQHS